MNALVTSNSSPLHHTWKFLNRSLLRRFLNVGVDAVAREALDEALTQRHRGFRGARRWGVGDSNRHAGLDAPRQRLTLAVRLPTAERAQPGIGRVALRLSVSNEPDVARAAVALLEEARAAARSLVERWCWLHSRA